MLEQDSKPGDDLPVIVYIYGGIFKFGDTQREGPQYFMGRDVVLVMVSFRLGALGFLTTGDSVIPGNMGLKDQTMALKWTKKYIYDFGGNPDKITLVGHSSGAACVHLHTLSPLSKGRVYWLVCEINSFVIEKAKRARFSRIAVSPIKKKPEDKKSHRWNRQRTRDGMCKFMIERIWNTDCPARLKFMNPVLATTAHGRWNRSIFAS